jgi:drug/metabolite transporter (DMT)-like permease
MNSNTIKRMGLLEWALLLTLSIIWGGSFFFNAVALRGLPPMLVVFGRISIGCLGLLAIISLTSLTLRPYLCRWRQFLIIGVLNTAIPFSLIVWGQQYIASGLAAVINATTPAFTILVAHFITSDERASMRKFFGAIIGLGGVATLIGLDALGGFGDHILGQAAVMGAALCYAFAGSYARRLHDIPPPILACGQLAGSTIVLLPLVLFITRPWELSLPSADVLGAVVGLGLVCSTLAYLIFFRLLSTVGITNISLVTLLIPLSASTLGMAFLNEPFTWRLVAGMAIICVAAALIDGRLKLRR